MRLNSALAFAVALVAVALAPASNATIVYLQPTLWAGNGTDVGSSWTSHTDPSITGFRTNDDFSVGSAATIDEVTWWGIYIHTDLTNASPNTTDWSIRFQADNAGVPGAILASETLPAAQVTRQLVGTGIVVGNTVDVYQFTAPFPNFSAAAGITYWFSTLSRGPTFDPLFSWIEGTGGNGTSFQTQFANGVVTDTFIREGDRAFALSQLPEPSTLVLIGAGLAALVSRRRLPVPSLA
jgi:hypothetical protein